MTNHSMRRLIVLVALLATGCGGSSTAPTPPMVTPPVVTPPPVVANVTVSACPASIVGFALDLGFYQQIGCNAFDGPMQPTVRRWAVAPKLYIRTVDEAGAAIDSVTLQTVQDAMSSAAPALTGGKFGLASIERGTETREGTAGYITVKWLTTTDPTATCGRSQVSVDGGWLELHPYVGGGCSCGGSKIRSRTAKHELGHALGYWHTNDANDLMSALANPACDSSLSSRELQAAAYQYR